MSERLVTHLNCLRGTVRRGNLSVPAFRFIAGIRLQQGTSVHGGQLEWDVCGLSGRIAAAWQAQNSICCPV